jgi:hypothetical protein
MWSDRLPFIVVPLSKSWNGVSVVSKILDLHKWSVAALLLFEAGHRRPATGDRPPATGHRPPATDHRSPITDH